ncbi:unnamed protein product [Trichobilharzia szidati]|nr:unnamed protein product [Trichobilharzia szidati]
MYSRMREGQRVYCCSNRRKCRNNIAFWCFGLGNNFSYVIMLSAAVDIIRRQENPEIKSTSNIAENRINCTQIGTGSVLLADILPSMLFKFIAPMFIHRLHFHFKIICAVLLAVNSFLMVSFSQSFYMSLLGIVSASLSSGIGDVSFLSMLAFFDKYFFILNRPHHSKFRCGINYTPSSISSRRPSQDLNTLNADDAAELVDTCMTDCSFQRKKSIASDYLLNLHNVNCLSQPPTNYRFVFDNIDGISEDENNSNAAVFMNNEGYMQLTDADESMSPAIPSVLQQLHPNWLVKFQLLKFELMYFQNSHLTAPEQYRWYQVLYQLGVFISRSSVSFIHIENTWLLSLLQAINFVIFLLQVMYAYIPYIWIVFILIFYEGCLGGLTYVNTFYNIIQRTNTVYREYAMAMAAVSDSIGIAGAGFLAIPLHNWLCNRMK